MMTSMANRSMDLLGHLSPGGTCALSSAFEDFYPDTCSSLDGAWVERGVIRGSSLVWDKGRMVRLQIQGPTTLHMELQGEIHAVSLKDSRMHMVWSDGDVWERADRPFAEFQRLLAVTIGRGGWTDKISHSRLGPDRWHERPR